LEVQTDGEATDPSEMKERPSPAALPSFNQTLAGQSMALDTHALARFRARVKHESRKLLQPSWNVPFERS